MSAVGGMGEQMCVEVITGRLSGRQVGVRGDSPNPHLLCPLLILALCYLPEPFPPPSGTWTTWLPVAARILFPPISDHNLSVDILKSQTCKTSLLLLIPSPFLILFTDVLMLFLLPRTFPPTFLPGPSLSCYPLQVPPLSAFLSNSLTVSLWKRCSFSLSLSLEAPQCNSICSWGQLDTWTQTTLVIKDSDAGVKPSEFKSWPVHFWEKRYWTFPSLALSSSVICKGASSSADCLVMP